MTATGYSGKSLEDLLDIVENRDYATSEGFWIAKELRERLTSAKEVRVLTWDKDKKEWVIVDG